MILNLSWWSLSNSERGSRVCTTCKIENIKRGEVSPFTSPVPPGAAPYGYDNALSVPSLITKIPLKEANVVSYINDRIKHLQLLKMNAFDSLTILCFKSTCINNFSVLQRVTP